MIAEINDFELINTVSVAPPVYAPLGQHAADIWRL